MSGRGEEGADLKTSGSREEQNSSGPEIALSSQESQIVFGSY